MIVVEDRSTPNLLIAQNFVAEIARIMSKSFTDDVDGWSYIDKADMSHVSPGGIAEDLVAMMVMCGWPRRSQTWDSCRLAATSPGSPAKS